MNTETNNAALLALVETVHALDSKIAEHQNLIQQHQERIAELETARETITTQIVTLFPSQDLGAPSETVIQAAERIASESDAEQKKGKKATRTEEETRDSGWTLESAIVDYLNQNSEYMFKRAGLIDALREGNYNVDFKDNSVQPTLSRLKKHGKVQNPERGYYQSIR